MSPRIQTLIANFVDELTKAIQQEGAAAFAAAIGGEQGVVTTQRSAARGPRAGASRAPSAAAKAPARRKGAKRSPEELEALTKTLLAAIKKTPGARIEEIGKGLGIATKELALPVAKLFEAKAIKTTGQRRATKYFPR
jgi:hypothetical protein